MAFNYEYPYTDPYRHNADWLLHTMKRLEEEWKIFVPTHDVKFGGEWDGTRPYEAYTIVNDSNWNSYISVKAVPASRPITDTTYWLKLGDYNAQLAQYREDLETYRDETSAEVLEVSENLDTLNGEFQQYKEDTVDVISEAFVKAGAGRGVFIGDSYSDRSTGYTQALPDIIGNDMKLKAVHNFAVAGAGYVNGDTTNKHFRGQLEMANATMTTKEKSETSYVFILGGQNDSGHSTSDCIAQYSTIFRDAYNMFPNAKLVVLPLWYNRALNALNSARFTLLYYYANQYHCMTDYLSWSYLINPSFANGFMPDGVHPTQATLNVLGGMISCFAQGGNPRIPAWSGVFTKQAIVTATNSYAWFDGENVHLHYVGSHSGSSIPVGTNVGGFASCYAPLNPVVVKCFTGSDNVQFTINTDGTMTTATQLSQNEVWICDVCYPLHDSPIASL